MYSVFILYLLMANNSVAPLDECNVFVKYLPSDLTDQDFYKLFSPFGEIISSKIMVDQSTGKSLGYGFVSLTDYIFCTDIRLLNFREYDANGRY